MRKIKEKEATVLFIHELMKKVDNNWDELFVQLNRISDNKFNLSDIKSIDHAKLDLMFIIIVLEIITVENLYSLETSKRVFDLVMKSFDEISIDKFYNFREKIKSYSNEIKQSLEQHQRNNKYFPLEKIADTLIHDWFADNVDRFYLKIDKYYPGFEPDQKVIVEWERLNGSRGIINPYYLGILSVTLNSFVGFWKKIRDNFELIEEN